MSAVISTFHMVKCIQRYRSIVQMTKHAKTAGEDSSDPPCCISKVNAKLQDYGIKGTDGFVRAME